MTDLSCRWREWCGMKPMTSWEDLHGVMSNKSVKEYTFLYCSPFSYCSYNFVIAKVVALNLLLQLLLIGSLLLFCIASNIVIALRTIATAIVVALLRS